MPAHNHNPLGETPESFVAHCRQCETDWFPVRKWRVKIGASLAGSIGALYNVKREYEIVASRPDLFDAAISRAYQDGDIEHVRVEFYQVVKES
jgi:hypothetical protein